MTAFVIKMIAILTMLTDHTGAVFDLHFGYRVVGRIAFPLFVFLIAEGCRHTKSMEKYLLRLGLFALISEVPFDLAFGNDIDFLNSTNIFYTLFLGVMCVYIFKQMRSAPYFWLFSAVPVYGIMMAADWLGTDYGGIGVLFIFLTAAVCEFKNINYERFLQAGIMIIFMMWLYYPNMLLLAGSFAALPLILLYSGEIGVNVKNVKYVFYLFYPVHLALLYGIYLLH